MGYVCWGGRIIRENLTNILQDTGDMGTGEAIKERHTGKHTQPGHADTLLSPPSSQPRAGPQPLPPPAHHRHLSARPQDLRIMEGASTC